MPEAEKKLWAEMAAVTAPLCAGKGPGACRAPHSCCDAIYCREALDFAAETGEELKPINYDPRLPLMGPDGCIAPPHLRPMCTMHVCCINGLGFNPRDLVWTKRYFKLRAKLGAH
jgi:hypothetical protein